MNNIANNLKKLIDVGRALSREKNISILLEKILNEARIISNSDGGTVYLVTEDGKKLNFEIMHTQSLDIKFGGSTMPVPDRGVAHRARQRPEGGTVFAQAPYQ